MLKIINEKNIELKINTTPEPLSNAYNISILQIIAIDLYLNLCLDAEISLLSQQLR